MQEDTITEEEPEAKRVRVNENEKAGGSSSSNNSSVPKRIETGFFSKIPSELFPHILKFLSSEVPLPFFHQIYIFVYFCFD